MALTTTLEIMRDGVYRTSDTLQFTGKHPTTRVNDLLNQGLGALSRICRTTNPEFQPIGSTTITFDGAATTYALPSNFRSLLMVVYTDGNSKQDWLTPWELHERAVLTESNTTAAALRANCYRLVGTNIEFLPRPPANHTALLWYATTVTQLVSDAEAWDTMERLDTYPIWWAAREICMERADWDRHDRLTAKLAELEADVRVLARSIDVSHPGRVVDLGYARRAEGRRRWR